MNNGKYYTLYIEDGEIYLVNKQHILDAILNKISMIYEYADELDAFAHEHSHQINEIVEKLQKKNHDPLSDHDSLIEF